MAPIRIVIVEDHALVRESLRELLAREEDMAVVQAVGTGGDALRLCRTAPPDVVVLDLVLPDVSGLDVMAELRRVAPATRAVVLSACADEESVLAAMQAGARGYVVKRASAGVLMEAIRTVARGGSYMCPELMGWLVRHVHGEAPARDLRRLSPREVQVLRLIAAGKTSKEAAALLNLRPETLRTYRKSVMKKLGACNIAGLTRIALAEGMLPGPPPSV
jgi:DNA-binding NarL/FixJ family response regulator